MIVSQRNFIIVKDRTHSCEGNSADLGDILVLEEWLQQNSMLSCYLSQSLHQGVNALLIFLSIGHSVVEVFGTKGGLFLTILG